MAKEELIELIKKIAYGYEYEEVQTILEETSSGTKKKIVRTKKFQPANLQAAQYLLTKDRKIVSEIDMDKLIEDTKKKLEVDEEWKLK